MKIDGGCHCGYIRYEAEIDPEKTAICHCGDCQTLSGSAFRTVAFAREGTFQAALGRANDLRQDGRQRGGAGAILLPAVRSADLLEQPRRRTEGPRHPRGHHSPAKRACPESADLVFRSSQTWLGNLGTVPKLEKQPGLDQRGRIA